MKAAWLGVVNRAAGGGRCGKRVDAALDQLRQQGLDIDVVESQQPGHGIELARRAYAEGYRRFIAFGGDGTSYEIVNGVFPECLEHGAITLAFQPLGTGNSFLRDFTQEGLAYATAALVQGKQRACDVMCMRHRDGTLYSINLLSMGFAADVAVMANRRFKSFGHLGYLLGVFACLLKLERRVIPLRLEEDNGFNRERSLFLSFNNSRFTGGTMMIAPEADTADGLISVVRWGPIGRWELIRNLHRLYDGSHTQHPAASSHQTRRVVFEVDQPLDVMVDGEVCTIQCEELQILPGALHVVA
jgi:YegS/Rv2252/BmrU family lipid kinase